MTEEKVWNQPHPEDNLAAPYQGYYGDEDSDPLIQFQRAQTADELSKPGYWIGTARRSKTGNMGRGIVMSCPYRDCCGSFATPYIGVEKKRYSLYCAHCERHIWAWFEGEWGLEENPFKVVRKRKRRVLK